MATGELEAEAREEFRTELRTLQVDLRNYTHLLADLADVEDITDLASL